MAPADRSADDPLLRVFRRAAALPWYRTILEEHGVAPDAITTRDDFRARVPVLDKHRTFDRFTPRELASGVSIPDLAGVLTSSGHGGRFSFGLITRQDAADAPHFIDEAVDRAFAVRSRPTLAINCLPMGVTFPSATMTVATTSVREDMAVALVKAFGPEYAQILLVVDPLFLKRLLDYAAGQGLDWRQHHVHVVIGEEVFGERFREYVAAALGLDLERPEGGYIMSSFGVGELGLHLCYETLGTIAIRRATRRVPAFGRAVLGPRFQESGVPAVLSYEPRRTFIESLDPDANGFGRMAVSMLDPALAVPLLRYQTGDVAKLLDRDVVLDAAQTHGVPLPEDVPRELIAIAGRDRDRMPNGAHVALYKDALYASHDVAARLTGAVRIAFDGDACTLHVQLTPSATPYPDLADRLATVIPHAFRPREIVAWAYEQFPYGMTLDYERKFRYFTPDGA